MSRPPAAPGAVPRALAPGWIPGAALAALSVVALSVLAPRVWLMLVIDGLPVAALLAAALGIGCWPARWLLAGAPLPRGMLPALSVGLGLALIGDATLLLGCLGIFSAEAAVGILAVGFLTGMVAWRRRPQPGVPRPDAKITRGAALARALLLAPLVAPFVLLAVGATLPPGMLWREEAGAYDALEYHLQVPREYFEAGAITFLPHNVYSNFPQQVEILYYFLFVLGRAPLVGALTAQMLHAALAGLSVLAACAALPRGTGRTVTATLLGCTPWLAYLGVLAYVECGVLLYSALALALLLPELDEARGGTRRVIAAGVCAGLASGCKYTAVVLVAICLALTLLLLLRGALRARLRNFALFGTAALLAFSPWMIRNVAFTGNPVYPLAWSIFGGRNWSAAQAEQWSRAHAVRADQASAAARAGTALRELFGHVDAQGGPRAGLFGAGLVAGAVAGAVLVRDRRTAFLVLWSVFALVVWATATQMPGRFLTPLLAPLALLCGRAIDGSTLRECIGSALGFGVACLGGWQLAARWTEHAQYWSRAPEPELSVYSGVADLFADAHPLNRLAAPDARFWLIGDAAVFHISRPVHYTVVFNRDPWVELAAAGAAPRELIAWLRARGWTHVVFQWSEIERLRRTYGFADVVRPALAESLIAGGMRPVRHEGPPSMQVLAAPPEAQE